MAAIYPAARSYFDSSEFGPAIPEVAIGIRRLMDWQNYTYNNDLPVSPWDTKVFSATPIAANTGSNALGARRTVTATVTEIGLGAFRMPSPRGPCTQVRWWFWVVLGDSSSTGTIHIQTLSTLSDSTIAVTYAACGSVTTGAWLSVDVPSLAEQSFEVRLTYGAGTSVTVDAISSYWLPSDLWAPNAYAPISQAWAAADRSDSRYFWRHLAQAANRFLERRAPLQCVASYLGEWAGGGGGTSATMGAGRYRFVIGARVSSVKVAVQAALTAAGTYPVKVKFGGSVVATISITSTSFAWYTATISVTPSDTETEIDCEIEIKDEVTVVWVSSVSLWESAATFTLPGAETVPANFAPNDNGALVGGSAITAAQRATVAANMAWLWKYRGLRSLVCDSRWAAPCREGNPTVDLKDVIHSPPSADIEVQGCRYFAFANGAVGVPRMASARHVGNDQATRAVCSSWTDEPAHKADTNTAWRDVATGVGPPEVVDSPPGTFTFDETFYPTIRPLIAQHGPWAQSTAAEQEYRTWTVSDGGANDLVGTRVCGMSIEQMPLNSTSGTRA